MSIQSRDGKHYELPEQSVRTACVQEVESLDWWPGHQEWYASIYLQRPVLCSREQETKAWYYSSGLLLCPAAEPASSFHRHVSEQTWISSSSAVFISATLFNVKINDIVKQVDPGVEFSFYVDDFVIMYRSPTIDVFQRKLQHTINRLEKMDSHKWCNYFQE